ncbi:MAG TPA: hypothetical protein VNQ76_16235 [Planctomicrobium sp.]|nr:hypothetical protein [Planctomicrobium sp.]
MSNTTSTTDETLLSCNYREETETPHLYFCRHTQVRVANGLVTAPICQRCSMRLKPCLQPRDRSEMVQCAPQNTQRNSGHVPHRPPSLIQQGWNLTQALAAFTANGFKTVTAEEYAARLAICDTCEKRQGTRCMQCGCGLTLKARGRAFSCPLKKWSSPAKNSR